MAADQLTPSHLRVATYNVHDCVGRDGAYSPDRIASVVAGLDADVVALQEVTLDHAGDVVGLLQKNTRMQAIDGTLFERGIGRYGNLLLCRPSVIGQALHDLSFSGREPRGVIEAHLQTGLNRFSVFATHLGLSSRERRIQIAGLARLAAESPHPTILMGDFNIWYTRGALAPIRRAGFAGKTVASYPSRPWPVLALDRVFARSPAVVTRCWRGTGATTAMASDHLPILAEVDLRPA